MGGRLDLTRTFLGECLEGGAKYVPSCVSRMPTESSNLHHGHGLVPLSILKEVYMVWCLRRGGIIAELMGMERGGRYGMSRERMESIRGFLVYVSRTYRYMTPYSKGVYLTL